MKTAPRILVAQIPEAAALTEEALHGYELILVNDAQQAQYQVMKDGIDLFVIGIHFDDSRAVELVSFIRQDGKHKNTPIVIVRFLASPMADLIRTTINSLMKIGSISDYLELEDVPNAQKTLRKAVERCLPAAKKIPIK